MSNRLDCFPEYSGVNTLTNRSSAKYCKTFIFVQDTIFSRTPQMAKSQEKCQQQPHDVEVSEQGDCSHSPSPVS